MSNQNTPFIPAGQPISGVPVQGSPIGQPLHVGAGLPVGGFPLGGMPLGSVPGGSPILMAGQSIPASALLSGTMQPLQTNAPFVSNNNGMMSVMGQPNFGDSAEAIVGRTSANTIKIRKMTLMETKGQQEQRARSYIPLIDGNTLNVLQNYKDRTPDMQVTATDVANMHAQGAQFFQTSAQPGAVVGIQNGWGTRRFSFTLTAEIYFNGTLYTTEYIAGYTDHHGVSNIGGGQSLDPNMVFVITSMTRSSPRPIVNANNGVGHTVVAASNVIADSVLPNFAGPSQIRTSRPSDVFSELGVLANRRGAEILAGQAATMGAATIPYVNMNTAIGSTPKLSNVQNNVASMYAANLLSSAAKGLLNPSESSNPFTIARSACTGKDEAYSSSHFVHMLNERNGSLTGIAGNTFTLGSLYSIDPQLASPADDRIAVMPSDTFAREITRTATGQAIMVPAGTSCDSFSGTGKNVANSITVMHAAAALFRAAGVSYVSCRLTNYSGVDEFAISSLYGIDDGLLGKRASDACTNLIRDTVMAITHGQQSYEIDLVVDINNDAYIKIAIGMSPASEHVMPFFALASMTPVVGQQTTLDTLVTGVKTITDHLFEPSQTFGDFGGFNPTGISY